ncbi:MAG TPA: hypothetical protein VGN14_00595 [Candidatus Elarobacter sp.]
MEHLVGAIWRRRFVLLVILVAGGVFSTLVAGQIKPKFAAQSTVLMAAEQSAPNDPQAGRSPIKPILSGDLPMLATTPTVLLRVARDLNLQTDGAAIDALQHRVKAKLSVPTSLPTGEAAAGVLVIKFSGATERDAVDGANAVAGEVTAFYRDNATARFGALIADLEGQLAHRRQSLNAIDLRIANMAAANPLLDPKSGTGPLTAQYQRLAGERADAYATALGDRDAAHVLGRRLAETAPAAHRDITESDPTFHNLRDQYARDYAQLKRLRAQYSSAYPGLPELEHAVAQERAAMLKQERGLRALSPAASTVYVAASDEKTRAESTVASDDAHLRGLDGMLTDTDRQLHGGRGAAAELIALQRDHDAGSSAFTVLSSRLAEAVADKAEAGSVGSVNVLDRATYAKQAIYTLPLFVAAVAVGLTLALAALALLLLERFDRRLHTARIVEDVYGVPVVATLK